MLDELGLHDFVLRLGPVHFWVLFAALALALLAATSQCFRYLRRLRLIEDTPTARVGAAAQGYVELEGTVDLPRGRLLVSPLRGVPCAWWSYRKEDLEARVVESGKSDELFLIRDASGACAIDPREAEVIGAETQSWSEGAHGFSESVIRVGQPLYALGLFKTAHDHGEKAFQREVGTLISTWKLNRLELARRFDANRDGTIDPVEWDAAWQAATDEVRRRRNRHDPVLHVLCKPPRDRRPFLLSVLGQRRLAGRLWFRSITSLLLAGTISMLLLWSLAVRGLL
jgi:hypothetical protein